MSEHSPDPTQPPPTEIERETFPFRALKQWLDAHQRQDPEALALAEIEAHAVLDRIEHDLPVVEQRTERLMHRYGL